MKKATLPFPASQLDFGDPTEMYKVQAVNYEKAAIHLAETFPLPPSGLATKSEIQAVQRVIATWLAVEEKLKAIANK
jgi:hypothetical protein